VAEFEVARCSACGDPLYGERETYGHSNATMTTIEVCCLHGGPLTASQPIGPDIAAEARRRADKLELHYTPKHGSRLKMADLELSVLASQCLDRRRPDVSVVANVA
jgi:hypothetical protein